ncbi:hypothetical protein Dimus_032103 [Dionaea muscipula]
MLVRLPRTRNQEGARAMSLVAPRALQLPAKAAVRAPLRCPPSHTPLCCSQGALAARRPQDERAHCSRGALAACRPPLPARGAGHTQAAGRVGLLPAPPRLTAVTGCSRGRVNIRRLHWSLFGAWKSQLVVTHTAYATHRHAWRPCMADLHRCRSSSPSS